VASRPLGSSSDDAPAGPAARPEPPPGSARASRRGAGRGRRSGGRAVRGGEAWALAKNLELFPRSVGGALSHAPLPPTEDTRGAESRGANVRSSGGCALYT
jgi:hypothetical protein